MAEQGQGTKREGDEDSENGLQHKKARHDGLDDIQEILRNTKLADLERKRQKIVALEHNSTIGQALKDLAKHKILSAPIVVAPGLEDVLDTPSQEVANEALVGWLDIKDVLDSLLRFLGESTRGKLDLPMLALMQLLDKEGSQFLDKMVITVAGGGDRQLVYKANDSASILDTIQNQFLLPPDEEGKQQVVHRLAIFDAEGSILAIISQLDIMKFLLDHAEEMGDTASKSLLQLGILVGKPPVTVVDPHLPTLLAFKRMFDEGVSGAAVCLSDTHELIANLSISDLRSIQPDHLSVLALPVAEFLALTHHTTYIGYSASKSQSAGHPFFASTPKGVGHKTPFTDDADDVRLVTCTQNTTLVELLKLMVDNKIHRVYVAEDGVPLIPTAVVTCTDVMRVVSGVW